jgi:hypothetical protein
MISVIVLLIIAVIVFLLLLVFLSGLIANAAGRVPFVPTSKEDIEDLVQRLHITSKDTFIDLGSGNGRVIFAVEQLTGAQVRGYEFPSWMHWYAKLKKILANSQAQLISGNFFKHSWSDATVVYCYLFPPVMSKIGEKVQTDLLPGARVVVRDFPIPNLSLKEQWQTPSDHTIYLYQV